MFFRRLQLLSQHVGRPRVFFHYILVFSLKHVPIEDDTHFSAGHFNSEALA